MRVLILGGTDFVGRHFAEAIPERDLTLFNRGRTNPGLFPAARHLTGDRSSDVSALRGRGWDVAIDCSGQFPDWVRRSVEALKNTVGLYVHISSTLVYADKSRPGLTESAPTLEGTPAHELTAATYPHLKAESERVVLGVMGARALIVRASLEVGPYETADRLPYWIRRIREGETVLAPGRPERPVQLLDARDLAAWVLKAARVGLNGVFNAGSQAGWLTMGRLLSETAAALGRDPHLVWADDQFLLSAGLRPWVDMPIWRPETDEDRGFLMVDCSAAEAAGLSMRPLQQTVLDTLAWDVARGLPALKAGITPRQEQELLEQLTTGNEDQA